MTFIQPFHIAKIQSYMSHSRFHLIFLGNIIFLGNKIDLLKKTHFKSE